MPETSAQWELTSGDESELYPTYEAGRAAQLALNAMGQPGSTLERIDPAA